MKKRIAPWQGHLEFQLKEPFSKKALRLFNCCYKLYNPLCLQNLLISAKGGLKFPRIIPC